MHTKKHTEKIIQKLKARNSILKKLTGTTWSAHQTTLRISTLALCCSTAESCAPVWERSKHTKKIDALVNTTMKIPPHIQKEELTQHSHLQLENLSDNMLITTIIETAQSTARLKSQKVYKVFAKHTKSFVTLCARPWKIKTRLNLK